MVDEISKESVSSTDVDLTVFRGKKSYVVTDFYHVSEIDVTCRQRCLMEDMPYARARYRGQYFHS